MKKYNLKAKLAAFFLSMSVAPLFAMDTSIEENIFKFPGSTLRDALTISKEIGIIPEENRRSVFDAVNAIVTQGYHEASWPTRTQMIRTLNKILTTPAKAESFNEYVHIWHSLTNEISFSNAHMPHCPFTEQHAAHVLNNIAEMAPADLDGYRNTVISVFTTFSADTDAVTWLGMMNSIAVHEWPIYIDAVLQLNSYTIAPLELSFCFHLHSPAFTSMAAQIVHSYTQSEQAQQRVTSDELYQNIRTHTNIVQSRYLSDLLTPKALKTLVWASKGSFEFKLEEIFTQFPNMSLEGEDNICSHTNDFPVKITNEITQQIVQAAQEAIAQIDFLNPEVSIQDKQTAVWKAIDTARRNAAKILANR